MTCSLEDCGRVVLARGLCAPHYKRWWRHGDPLAGNRRAPDGSTAEERLQYVGWTESLLVPALGPCWQWNGLTDRDGYGRLWDGTRVVSAHRLAHTTWIGPVPPGALVRHRCDNPPCIRPAHLHPGTDKSNAVDRSERDRWQGSRTLLVTAEDAEAIRSGYTGRRGEQADLAREYGVSPSYISQVLAARP